MNENEQWMFNEIKTEARAINLQLSGLPEEIKVPLRRDVVNEIAPVTYVLAYSSWAGDKRIIGVGHELDLVKALAQRWYDEEYKPSLHTNIFEDDEITWCDRFASSMSIDWSPFGRNAILFGNAAAFDIDESLFVEIFQSSH